MSRTSFFRAAAVLDLPWEEAGTEDVVSLGRAFTRLLEIVQKERHPALLLARASGARSDSA